MMASGGIYPRGGLVGAGLIKPQSPENATLTDASPDKFAGGAEARAAGRTLAEVRRVPP